MGTVAMLTLQGRCEVHIHRRKKPPLYSSISPIPRLGLRTGQDSVLSPYTVPVLPLDGGSVFCADYQLLVQLLGECAV